MAHINPTQVLFTADLKSFASYGLDSGASTPTPESTPKRKRAAKKTEILVEQVVELAAEINLIVKEEDEEAVGSLAERVKKRRRVTVKT